MTQWHNINGESGRAWESWRDHESNKWSSFFINIINAKHTLPMENGPWILTEAARLGCLQMIKVLLESEAVPKYFRQAILSDGGRDWNSHHLSVAEAAYWGHLDVVDHLCQQGGIDVHLRHLGPNGDTVYHAAARTDRTEIFQVLYSCWLEAIDQANNHDRPLARLVFNRPRGIDPIEAVNFLLYTGGADPNAQDSSGGTALTTAVGGGSIGLIRTLIDGGADIGQVLGRGDSGNPYLKVQCSSPTLGINDKILDTLCSMEASV